MRVEGSTRLTDLASNSNESVSIATAYLRAYVCSVPVMKPCGKKNTAGAGRTDNNEGREGGWGQEQYASIQMAKKKMQPPSN